MSTLLTAASCDPPAAYDELPEASADEDDLQFRTTYGSGSGANPPVYSNTCAIGDHAFNELDVTGKPHEGTMLKGVYLENPNVKGWAPTTFSEVWVEPDGEIRGRAGMLTFRGSQMQGTRWVIEKERDGVVETREMTIREYSYNASERLHRYVLTYPNDPSYGLHFYNSAVPLLSGNQRSACVPDEDGSIEAVMLGGYHIDLTTSDVSERDRTLVFACMSGALGKALRWGYRPGSSNLDADAYKTAIRMVRADYCGDGISWTEPGQEIDILDRWHINDWLNPGQFTATEAVWGPDGAICLGTPRLKGQFTADDIECPNGPLPACSGVDETTYETEGKIWTRIWPKQ